MFKLRSWSKRTWTSSPHLLSSEHGKVLADASGDVQRGLEVIEFACGIPQALKGEYTVGAGPGIDVYSMRQPLGIGAGITPFNFPAMIPMWMFGMAIACGNAFILKPSERDPSRSRPPRRADEGSRPSRRHPQRRPWRQGNGRRDPRPSRHRGGQLRRLAPTSRSTSIRAAPRTASASRPSAAPRTTASSCPTPTSTRSSTTSPAPPSARPASAAWRCRWWCRSATTPPTPAREAGAGDRSAAGRSLDRPRGALRPGRQQGAQGADRATTSRWASTRARELVVDGRGFMLQGHEEGFFIGPTLFDHVKPSMKTYKDEIFGPVLQMVRAQRLRGGGAPPLRA